MRHVREAEMIDQGGAAATVDDDHRRLMDATASALGRWSDSDVDYNRLLTILGEANPFLLRIVESQSDQVSSELEVLEIETSPELAEIYALVAPALNRAGFGTFEVETSELQADDPSKVIVIIAEETPYEYILPVFAQTVTYLNPDGEIRPDLLTKAMVRILVQYRGNQFRPLQGGNGGAYE